MNVSIMLTQWKESTFDNNVPYVAMLYHPESGFQLDIASHNQRLSVPDQSLKLLRDLLNYHFADQAPESPEAEYLDAGQQYDGAGWDY